MTYKEFKNECLKSSWGKVVFVLWMNNKISLVPAMDLLQKNQNIQLSFNL